MKMRMKLKIFKPFKGKKLAFKNSLVLCLIKNIPTVYHFCFSHFVYF